MIIDMAEVIPRNSLKTTLKIFRQYIIISLDADVTVLNCINSMCSIVINIYEHDNYVNDG